VRPSAEALEALARRLRGVYACQVDIDVASGMPARVHLTADISRRTAVARDVQSAFFAAFDLLVPLERIAVTTVRRPDGEGPGLASGGGRLRLIAVRYQEEGDGQRVSVSLRQGEQEATGVAEAGCGEDPLRAAAEAALAAVAVARAWPQPTTLEDVAKLPAGSQEAVLVRIRVPVAGGGADVRLGAALVRTDPREAAVRAALDAVNRFDPHRLLLASASDDF
jgi:hypothetical protein